MPTISIITAVLDGTHQHMLETYHSLLTQKMPEDWAWQWVVQEDGESGRPLEMLPSDSRISAGQGPRGRAAIARTLALNRAEGVLVRALDADDALTEGALAQDIATLTERPQLSWCVSPALILSPDGRHVTAQPEGEPEPGVLPPDHYFLTSERIDLLRLPGTTLCTYTDLVRALGGWQALPANDDIALLLAVEAVSQGWMHREASLLYRYWQGNTTDFASSASIQRHSALLARARALRASGWRWHRGIH